MIRAATTAPAQIPRLLTTLLLGAAGASALAQTPASAASDAASAVAQPGMPAAPKVSALAPAPAPAWQSLTPAQQALLAPLAHDWPRLSATQRSKWVNAVPMLASLPPPELARLHERMRDWARLTPAERRDARVGYQVVKQLDAEERQAKWEAYQALPPEKRQELAEKAAARRQAQASTPNHAVKPLAAAAKSNIVPPAPKLVAPTAVTGSLVQAKPGATTVLITRAPALPSHHAAGEAKVVADPALVDPQTLLPKSLKATAASAPDPHP